VYFTDKESLVGVQTPEQFATRLGLARPATAECQRYGCAVVEFEVPPGRAITWGAPYPGVQQGMTVGKAREWFLAGNVSLSDNMKVWIIDATQGPRNFELPL